MHGLSGTPEISVALQTKKVQIGKRLLLRWVIGNADYGIRKAGGSRSRQLPIPNIKLYISRVNAGASGKALLMSNAIKMTKLLSEKVKLCIRPCSLDINKYLSGNREIFHYQQKSLPCIRIKRCKLSRSPTTHELYSPACHVGTSLLTK